MTTTTTTIPATLSVITATLDNHSAYELGNTIVESVYRLAHEFHVETKITEIAGVRSDEGTHFERLEFAFNDLQEALTVGRRLKGDALRLVAVTYRDGEGIVAL